VAQSAAADLYIEDTPNVNLAPTAIGSVGGSQPHTNFQPYLCIDFIISLFDSSRAKHRGGHRARSVPAC
jgi:microcystin-dependent protein